MTFQQFARFRVWPLALVCCMFAAVASPLHAATGDGRYTKPGRLVSVHGRALNLYCFGSGSTTVVFDSGWEDWAPAWAIVQPAVARFTRTCTYDRAGSGFSAPGPMPRTSVRIADELNDALHAAGIGPPYILVGHSFGSYNIRTFAIRHLNEVSGMVLVDGEDGDVEPPAQRAADDRSYGDAIHELQRCRDALAAGRDVPTISLAPGKKAPCNHQFFRGLPERMFSPALNRTILQITRTKTALYDAVISEMREMPRDETYLQTHRLRLGVRPLRVLTAQNHFYVTARTPAALRRKAAAFERNEARNQAKWLVLSCRSKQVFAPRSGHYIELDQPNIVIHAIRRVLTLSKQSQHGCSA